MLASFLMCAQTSKDLIYSGGADSTIRTWDPRNGTVRLSVGSVCWCGGVMWCVVVCGLGNLKWDCESACECVLMRGRSRTRVSAASLTKPPQCISTIKLKGSITQLIHHTDHLFCLTSTETAITQVHPRSGKVIKRLEGHVRSQDMHTRTHRYTDTTHALR